MLSKMLKSIMMITCISPKRQLPLETFWGRLRFNSFVVNLTSTKHCISPTSLHREASSTGCSVVIARLVPGGDRPKVREVMSFTEPTPAGGRYKPSRFTGVLPQVCDAQKLISSERDHRDHLGERRLVQSKILPPPPCFSQKLLPIGAFLPSQAALKNRLAARGRIAVKSYWQAGCRFTVLKSTKHRYRSRAALSPELCIKIMRDATPRPALTKLQIRPIGSPGIERSSIKVWNFLCGQKKPQREVSRVP